MSEIERAISVMQQHKCEEIALYGDEYNLAIQALQEKQEREKGCEWCNPKTSKFDDAFVTDTEDGCKWCDKEHCDNEEDSCYGKAYATVKVKFCPNCGRKLGEKDG